MYTEKGKGKVHGFLQSLIVGSGILLTSVAAPAADVEWSAQARAMGSDNIRRTVPDLAHDGALFGLDTTLTLKGAKGRASYTLLGKGGWETLNEEGASAQTDGIYLVRGNCQVPMGVNAMLDASLESSRETAAPEQTTDLLQERYLTDRGRGRISATWRPTTRSEWRARAASTSVRRPDRETEENEAGLMSLFPVGRRVSLSLEAAGVDGSERISSDTWQERSAALVLTRQSGRLDSGTLRIDWQGSDLERGQTAVTESSERYGAVYSYGFSLVEGWTLTQTLGVDGLKSDSRPAKWEGRLELTLSDALASTNRAQVSLFTRPTLQRASEGSVQVSRETGAEASMEWRATRNLTVTPSVLYRVNDSFEADGGVARYNNSITRVRAAWIFPGSWTISLTGASETRDSTPDTLDLYENSLELALSRVFY